MTALNVTTAGNWVLSGCLNFTTTPKLWLQSKALFASATTPIKIDLSAVTQSDSSGIALLIAWQRYAGQLNKEIYFAHVPTTMQEIIHVSELKSILAIIP